MRSASDRILLSVFVAVFLTSCAAITRAADYQWSVELQPAIAGKAEPIRPRAFLWIPPACKQVRAVLVAQHNMLEEDIIEHPDFRKTMGDLGVAIIWISPAMDGPFDPKRSGDRFNSMMKSLADISGYQELEFAPIIPIGHSACASYPWNFAAWAPERTLGIISVHGDAPLTPLAGFGHQDATWDGRNLDGIPGLMVMGEYEWIEARLAPAIVFRSAHPKAVIAMLAEPGEGHFAASDDLIHYLAMFIRKCVEQRLPPISDVQLNKSPVLLPIDPTKGWLVQRWTLRQRRTVPPGPFSTYTGDGVDAFWAFDEEMATATQNYHADMTPKLPQLIGFVQDGKLVPAKPTHPMVNLKFEPMADGETFKLETRFLDTVTSMDNNGPGKNNHVRWTALPAGSPIGHATGGGPITICRIEGPVQQIVPGTFKLQFYRGASMINPTFWLCARHPGDDHFKSAVQQAAMPIPRNNSGTVQEITFDSIADQKTATSSVSLKATSSAGLPVSFYVREGPAEIDGDKIKFMPIPPRAKYPLKVTVVAWQWGRSSEPKIKTADPVEQSFSISRSDSR